MTKCFDKHLAPVLSAEEKTKFDAAVEVDIAKSGYKRDPDKESYKQAASAIYLDLVYEEFKYTSGFNLKSAELTPPQEKTKIADHVKQGISTFINTGIDLFKFIINKDLPEINSRFAKFVKKDELSTQEVAAVRDFQSFMKKHVDTALGRYGFINNNGIKNVKNKDRATALLGADLFQQLTYVINKGTSKERRVTTEAVKAALGYAAYKALYDLEDSTHFKNEDDIKELHGKRPVVPFSRAQEKLKNKHLRAGVAINNWGQYAFSALGLSAVKGSSPNMVANLKTALGAQVMQILRERNILRVEDIDALEYYRLFNTENPTAKDKLPKTRYFYTLERELQPYALTTPAQVKSLIEKYLAANKGSSGIIDKVFTGTTDTKEILYKPSAEITTKTPTGMAVPKLMQEAQAKVQSTPLEFERNQAELMVGMNEVEMGEGISFAQALVGIKTQTQISKYHKTQRAGIEATNDSLQKGLDTLNEYFDASYEETTVLPVYLKMDVWKMLRAGTTSSAIDPTGQKIHRYSIIDPEWVNAVRFDDQPMVENFLLRVAEGLGVPTDKDSNANNLPKFDELLDEIVIKDAIEAIQSKDPAQYDRIIDAVDFIGLKGGERVKTFSALVAYANYLTAQKDNQETFEASLMGEVDGVSNGPMLTLLLAGLTVGGLSQEELFAKGGFFIDGVNKDFNVYRGTGVPDLYEHVSQRMLDALTKTFPNSNPFMDSVGYFSGKNISKDKNAPVYELTTRKNIKSAVNPIMFGSAVFNAVRGLFTTFIDGIYEKIAEVNSMEKGQEKIDAVAELNRQLLSLGLITEEETVEALLEDFEIKPKEYEDLWNRYYFGDKKVGIGAIIKNSLDIYFSDYLEKRNRVTKVTTEAADLYIEAKKQLIDKALADAGIIFSKEQINVGLSQEQLDAIEKKLMEAGITPVMHNIWSQEEGDINAGLLLLKKYKGQTDDIQYGTTVTGNKPFLTGDAHHLAARSKGPVETNPGTLSASVPTHSLDGFISFTRMLELFKQGISSYNMHDSGGTVFSKMKEMSIEFNKATFYSLVKYSPSYSILEMALRNVEGLYKLSKEGAIEQNLFTLGAQVNLLQELLIDANEGTRAKLDFLKKVQHVSQYAFEGGSYEVTAEDRQLVNDQIDLEIDREISLHQRLAEITSKIKDDIDAAKPKEENKPTVTTPPVEPETPSTPEEAAVQADVPPNGEVPPTPPVNLLNKLFSKFYKDNSKYIPIVELLESIKADSINPAYVELAKLLGTSKAKVQIINTIEEIEDTVVRQSIKDSPTKFEDTKGVAVNGNIYLNNRYLSGLLREVPNELNAYELVLHEAIHSIISSYVNDENNHGTETYKNLQDLLTIVKRTEKSKQFENQLENVDEFVAYGLTDNDFQSFLSTLTISDKKTEINKYYINNVFTKFIETVAQIFQKFIKVTKDNKFDTRYTKDLNNVLLAVITQGTDLISDAIETNDPLFSVSKDGLVQAVTFKNKNLVGVNSDLQLTPKQRHAVLLHEIGVHYGLEAMIGKEAFAALLKKLESLKGKSEAVDKAYARVPKDTDPSLVNEEALAYLVENYANSSLVQSVLNKIKEWYSKLTGTALPFEQDAFKLASASLLKFNKRVKVVNTPNLGGKPKEGFVKVDFNNALKSSPEMHKLLDNIIDVFGNKVALTGSLAIAKVKDVYRSKDEQIHDLDFRYYGDSKALVETLKRDLKGSSLIRAFIDKKNSNMVVTIAVPVEGVSIFEITPIDNKNYVAFGSINGGEVQALSPKLYNAVDFFTYTKEDIGLTKSAYIGKDSKTRELNLVNAEEIFDAKFGIGRDKDINDALFAGVGNPLFSKTPTVSAMRMPNGLNTHSTMEVFDALNTSGLSTATTNHLRSLLSTIVYKLHGSFGTLHANVMRNTPVDAVGVYQDALNNGDLPIATAIGTASLPMTDAEAFAVDQVAITLEGALNNRAMYKYTRVLQLMYEQAFKELKPSDFGTNAQAANNIYKFIFDTPNTNQQSLIRFAALGLANKQVSDAFKKVNVVLPEVKIKNTLFSRLQWLFNNVIAFVTSKTTGISEGVSLDQNLERILKNLVASEAKYQAIASQPRKDNVLNVYLNKGMSAVGKQVTKAARSNFVRNNSIKNKGKFGDGVGTAMEIAGKVVDVTINGKIKDLVEGGMMARNRMFDGPLGISAGIINEMRNETNSNKKMSALARLVKHTEATREKMIEDTSREVLSMFKNNGSDLTKEQHISISNLLRTGIGVVGYTGTQVQEFITDHTKLDKEINDVLYKIRPLAKKHTKFLAAKAEATGFWLTSGIGVDPTRIATNATMVIQMQGTPVENALKNQKDQLLPEVEKLISLFGLRHMEKDVLNTVLDTEIPRGVDNGVDFVMRLHQRLNQDAKNTLFKDKEILMQHGYLPEVVNPNVDIKYVTATPNRTLAQNVATYQKAGYVSYGLLGRDKAHTVPTMMLVNKNVPATRRLTSLMAVIDDNTKGTLLHDGDFTGPFARANTVMNARVDAVTKANYAQWESKGFVFDRSYDKTLMVPLVDEQGKLVNARYMANSGMRDNVLERNNNFAYLLGKQIGTTYEKLTSKEQNNLAVKGLKDLYDVQYTKSPKDYYFVGLSSTDKEYKEAYMLLPYAARQEIKRIWGTEGMFVRKDMLDLVFGYRKLTVGDAMLKSKAEQNLIIRGMNNVAEYVFARNGSADDRYAARLKAANLMKVLQRGEEEIVTETKKTIVLRLAEVLFGNETSNMSFLKLKGMGVFEALQEKGKALTALNVYRNQSEELNRLTMYLNTGTKVNEHPEFIKRVAWLQESMNKNPVKPLIDAGFMPTIKEDVETISEDYSYKGWVISKMDEFADKNKFTKGMDNLSSQLYMGENTGSFQFMKYSTQVSDFTARYALYVHLSKDKTITEAERLSALSTSFINYDAPSHRMMEALNGVGLLWFTKYVLRVQQPLWEAVKANPSTALMFMLFNHFTDMFTLVTDSSVVNRIYNPFKLGALEYPFVLDDIAVMQAIGGAASLMTPE